MDVAAGLFGGENFARVIKFLLEYPGVIMTPTQIAAGSGIKSKDSLYRALARGQAAGLVRRHAVGAAGAYSIDTSSPIFPEVKVLIDKLTGFHTDLAEALARLDGVEVAFIYGSAATGRVRRDSDVDIFVIGAVSALEVSRTVTPVGAKYGRQVIATAYTRQEVSQRLQSGDPWAHQVMGSPKVFLLGGEDLLPTPTSGPTRWSQ